MACVAKPHVATGCRPSTHLGSEATLAIGLESDLEWEPHLDSGEAAQMARQPPYAISRLVYSRLAIADHKPRAHPNQLRDAPHCLVIPDSRRRQRREPPIRPLIKPVCTLTMHGSAFRFSECRATTPIGERVRYGLGRSEWRI